MGKKLQLYIPTGKCPKLTIKEHALITDMEGSYTARPEYRTRTITFTQKEKEVVDCWCENAMKIGVERCYVRPTGKRLWQAQVTGADAVMLAGEHLKSSGILSMYNKERAQKLFEYKVKYRRRIKAI